MRSALLPRSASEPGRRPNSISEPVTPDRCQRRSRPRSVGLDHQQRAAGRSWTGGDVAGRGPVEKRSDDVVDSEGVRSPIGGGTRERNRAGPPPVVAGGAGGARHRCGRCRRPGRFGLGPHRRPVLRLPRRHPGDPRRAGRAALRRSGRGPRTRARRRAGRHPGRAGGQPGRHRVLPDRAHGLRRRRRDLAHHVRWHGAVRVRRARGQPRLRRDGLLGRGRQSGAPDLRCAVRPLRRRDRRPEPPPADQQRLAGRRDRQRFREPPGLRRRQPEPVGRPRRSQRPAQPVVEHQAGRRPHRDRPGPHPVRARPPPPVGPGVGRRSVEPGRRLRFGPVADPEDRHDVHRGPLDHVHPGRPRASCPCPDRGSSNRSSPCRSQRLPSTTCGRWPPTGSG